MTDPVTMERQQPIWVAGADTLLGSAIVASLRRHGYDRLVGVDGDGPDERDLRDVAAFLASAKPARVFHAAGRVAGIEGNRKHPADLMADNLAVNLAILRGAHDAGVERLAYVASSCSYPRDCPQPMRESSLFGGPPESTNDAYAVAKLAGLKLCDAYRRQYGDDFIAVIPANVFGPEDDFSPAESHVIPGLIRRFHEAKAAGAAEVAVWGSGRPEREFLYADDFGDGMVFAMERYRGTGPVNLGGGETVAIARLAELVRAVTGFSGRIVFDTSRPDGMPVKRLDGTVLSGLGWRPSTPLAKALAAVYERFQQGLRP